MICTPTANRDKSARGGQLYATGANLAIAHGTRANLASRVHLKNATGAARPPRILHPADRRPKESRGLVYEEHGSPRNNEQFRDEMVRSRRALFSGEVPDRARFARRGELGSVSCEFQRCLARRRTHGHPLFDLTNSRATLCEATSSTPGAERLPHRVAVESSRS